MAKISLRQIIVYQYVAKQRRQTKDPQVNVSASVSKCATELSFWLYSFCGKLQLDFVDLEAKASSLQQQFITVSLKMAEGLRAF